MATFKKISGSGKWEAQICVRGVRKSRTFSTKREAQAWAFNLEESIRSGSLESNQTLREALEEYRNKITPTKRGRVFEDRRIRYYENDPIADMRLTDLTPAIFEEFLERRLSIPSARTGRLLARATAVRDINVLSAVMHWCIRKGYLLRNPLEGVAIPHPEPHRERVATDEEIEKICLIAGWDPKIAPVNATQRTAAAFLFSCLTGMRAGEILAIERSWHETPNVLRIPTEATKTLLGRDVALSSKAEALLNQIESLGFEPNVFGLAHATREALWGKIRDKAGLGAVRDSKGRVIREALRFPDGRATFATWAAMPGPDGAPRMDVLALARQLGHRDLKMLQRYYRPTAAQLASRL